MGQQSANNNTPNIDAGKKPSIDPNISPKPKASISFNFVIITKEQQMKERNSAYSFFTF